MKRIKKIIIIFVSISIIFILNLSLFCCLTIKEIRNEIQSSQDKYLFFDDNQYKFIEKKEINNKTYSLFLVKSGGHEKVDFVQVYEGDLEDIFKNQEKVDYYPPLLYEYIDDAPDELLHSTRYIANIHFSNENKSIIINFTNEEKQIIEFNID